MIGPLFWFRRCPACGKYWYSDQPDSPCPACGHDPTMPKLPAPRRRFADILAGFGQPPTRLGIVGHWGNLIPLGGLVDEAARHWADCEILAVATGKTPGEVAQIYQDEAAQLPWQITPRQALAIRAQKESRQRELAVIGDFAKTYAGAMADLQTAMEAIGAIMLEGLQATNPPQLAALYNELARLGAIAPQAASRRPRRLRGRKSARRPNRPAWKRQPKH